MPVLDPLTEKMWATATEFDGHWYFQCALHGYDTQAVLDAPSGPSHDCEDCWWIYYNKMFALTPRGKRGELADRALRAVVDASAAEGRNEFDYIPYARPKIEIVPGPDDDLKFD